MKKIILYAYLSVFIFLPFKNAVAGSFFYMGNGTINIKDGYHGGAGTIRFRNEDGTYNKNGLDKINGLYGGDESEQISLRLIELLDYIEDNLGGRGIQIRSGYRSPDYNESLQKKGNLAATSSLHIDAEAIDIIMDGVPSQKIYNYLYAKNCCGIGYYHGKTIHIDTGPPRFWDEKTSGTEKREPPQNENIILRTENDIYNDGETVGLKFSRVNEYPIGVVKEFRLSCMDGKVTKKLRPVFHEKSKTGVKGCIVLGTKAEGRTIHADLPSIKGHENELACTITADFCPPMTPKMPKSIASNPIVIKIISRNP